MWYPRNLLAGAPVTMHTMSNGIATLSAAEPSPKLVELLEAIANNQLTQLEALNDLSDLLRDQNLRQRQRARALESWREQNWGLAVSCRRAAEVLARAYNDALAELAQVVLDDEDVALCGFRRQELVDRYGYQLYHLDMLRCVLGELGGPATGDEGEPA